MATLPSDDGLDDIKIMSFPSVDHLRTAFPGMCLDFAQEFCEKLSTPNKKHWTLEIDPGDMSSPALNLGLVIEDIFSGDNLIRSPSRKLTSN